MPGRTENKTGSTLLQYTYILYSTPCKMCTRYRTCIRVMSIRVNRMTLIITMRRRRRKRSGEERRKEEREKEREGYLCIREREAATKGKCKGKACHSHCRPEKERRSSLQLWGKETRDRQVQEGTAGAGQTSFGFWFDRPTRQITCGRIETICLIGAFSSPPPRGDRCIISACRHQPAPTCSLACGQEKGGRGKLGTKQISLHIYGLRRKGRRSSYFVHIHRWNCAAFILLKTSNVCTTSSPSFSIYSSSPPPTFQHLCNERGGEPTVPRGREVV